MGLTERFLEKKKKGGGGGGGREKRKKERRTTTKNERKTRKNKKTKTKTQREREREKERKERKFFTLKELQEKNMQLVPWKYDNTSRFYTGCLHQYIIHLGFKLDVYIKISQVKDHYFH